MTIEFTVDHDHTFAGEVGIEQLIGWITFSVSTYPGDFRVREQGAGVSRVINLPSRRGWLAADGHLYKDQTLAAPCRLVANDPAFNLHHVTYRADFDLTTTGGDPVAVPHCFFPAPSTDTTLQLTKVMPDPSQPVMEVRTKGYVEDILDLQGGAAELLTGIAEDIGPGLLADAVTADLATRDIGFVDTGSSTIQFTIDGDPFGAPMTLPAAAWSGVVSRPQLYPVAGVDLTGATDARAAIQAVIDNAPAGSTVYLPGGKLLINAELVINKPLVIRGGGGMFSAANQGGTYPGSAGTTIVTSSTTANGLRITSAGVVLEDFAVVNTRAAVSPPSAGTGIFIDNGSNFRLSRLTVAGFYDCVRAEGRFGNIDGCNIFDPVRYGIFFTNDNVGEEDFGDQGVSNCNIAMYGRAGVNAMSAVRWESAGGIRFTGNKIVAGTGPGASGVLAFNYGLDIMVKAGTGTGEIMVAGGGISTASVACVRIGQQVGAESSGGLTNITITGVVFQGYGDTANAIVMGARLPANKHNVQLITVQGNTFKNFLPGGIIAYNMQGLIVGPNVWRDESFTGPLITLAGSSADGTDDFVSTQQVDVYRQTVVQTIQDHSVTIVRDRRRLATNGSLDGYVEYRYRRNVYTDATGWKTMYTIEAPDTGGAGVIDVTFAGEEQASGVPGYQNKVFIKKIRRTYTRHVNTSSTVTIATVGTDESATNNGSVINDPTAYTGLQVVDGGAGKILVQVALLTSGSKLRGEIEVNVSGRVQKFSLGVGT